VNPETIAALKRAGVLSLQTRLLIVLWRVLTWRHPRCINCQEADRARLERNSSGVWACTSCAAGWKYRDRPAGEAGQ
jgi:ribosomal protein L37AE/L43A